MSESQRKLMGSLTRLRARARWLLVLNGLFRVTAILLALALGLVLIDWLLWLPGPIRLAMSVCYLCVALWTAYRWVGRPAAVRIHLSDVAARLDRHFAHLNDRMSSTVNFLERFSTQRTDESPAMMRAVIAEAGRLIDDLPLRRVLTIRPMMRLMSVAAGAVLLWTAIGVAAPRWSAVGLRRYVQPLGAVDWPKRVRIVSVTKDEIVAMGDPISLVAHVTRGDSETLRPMVHLSDARGRTRSYYLESAGAGTYRWVGGAITEPLEYSFEAGDDATGRYSVRPVRRPAIQSAVAHLHPPDYASDRPVIETPLDAREFSAVLGSRIVLSIETTKPLARDETGQPAGVLEFESGKRVRLNPKPESQTRFLCEIPVEGSDTFQVRLTGVDGFRNADTTMFRLDAREDELPRVTVIEPAAQLEVTPEARVKVVVEMEDDFGITSAALAGQVRDRDGGFTKNLSESLVHSNTPQRARASVTHEWEIAPLELQPGDVAVYHVEANDNYQKNGQGHGPGQSADLRLKVISHQQFADRLQDDFELLRNKLRELLMTQEIVRDETVKAGGDPNESRDLSEGQKEAVLRLAAQQNRLATRTEQLSRMFEQVGEKIDRNRVDDASARQEARASAGTLKLVAKDAMAEAGRNLAEAAETDQPEPQREQMANATRQQDAAVETLQNMLQRMDRFGEFNDLVRKTQDLLDRQESVTRETAKAGRSTLGKKPEDLSAEEKKALETAARRQERLAEETESLVTHMAEQADAMEKRDPEGSEAIQEARRTAETRDVARKMQRAASGIRENRASQARDHQRDAEQTLMEMLSRLEKRQSRVLAELAKRLERAEETIRMLMQQQQKLLDANRSAQTENKVDAFAEQSERQTRLKRNTQQVAREISGHDRMIRPSRLVRSASTEMSQAAIKLTDGDGKKAEPPQETAIRNLSQALDVLAELRRKAAMEMLKKKLADVREELGEIREQQQAVRDGSEPIVNRAIEKRKLRRIDTQRLNRLTTRQRAIEEALRQIRRQIDTSAVYTWVIRRIGQDAETITTNMEQRDLSKKTLKLQDGIVSRIDRLIEALKIDPQDEESEQFAGGGGSGQGGQQRKRGIPPVAELKILKGMQLELNDRTVEAGEGFDSDTATEQQLQDIRALADDQEEIRSLAELVIQNATGGRQ